MLMGKPERRSEKMLSLQFSIEFTVSCDENADLAYDFINFIYETANCKKNMEYILSLTPQSEAEAELDETVRASLSLDEETLKRGQVTADFSKKKDVLEMYNKMWDKIKEVK